MFSVGRLFSRNWGCPECGIVKTEFEMVEIYKTQDPTT